MIHSEVCGTDATLSAMERAGLRAEIVERHRGAVGPLLAERAPELDFEELVAVRGERVGAATEVGM